MTDVVAPETPHYVPAPETQADGELTELNTRGFVQPNLSITAVDYADLPIIDLSKTATPEDRLALAHQTREAMSNHGFFYVINHGFTSAQASRLVLSSS